MSTLSKSGKIRPLTDAEMDRYARVRIAAYRKAPILAAGLYTMRPVYAPGLGTWAMDDKGRIYISYEGSAANWTAEDEVTGIIHELWHYLRRHGERREALGCDLPSLMLWNVAADLEINDDLETMKYTMLDSDPLPRKYDFPDGETAEQYLARLKNDPRFNNPTQCPCQDQNQDPSQGQGQGQGGGQDPSQDPSQGQGQGGGQDPSQDPSQGQGQGQGQCQGQGPGGGQGGGQDPSQGQGQGQCQGQGPGGGQGGGQDPSQGQGGGQDPSQGQGQGCPGHGGRGDYSGCDVVPDSWMAEADAVTDGLTEGQRKYIEKQVADAIKADASKNIGSSTSSLMGWAEEVLAPPKIDWRRKLRASVIGQLIAVAGSARSTYNRPNRRYDDKHFIIAGKQAVDPNVLIGIDKSGSMFSGELDMALSEATGILRSRGVKKVRITGVDVEAGLAGVQRGRKIDTARHLDAVGGGTDMREFFYMVRDMIPRLRPTNAILLTDGYTPTPTISDLVPGVHFLVGIICDADSYDDLSGKWPAGVETIHIDKAQMANA